MKVSMYQVFVNGKVMHPANGGAYQFETRHEAMQMARLCYSDNGRTLPDGVTVEEIELQELEQFEAADRQAHADHLRETMEDR